MKREIVADSDIDAFANETAGKNGSKASLVDPQPLIWIDGAELAEVRTIETGRVQSDHPFSPDMVSTER